MAWLVISNTGRKTAKPVVLSTRVQKATCPLAALGMSTRSMCMGSPSCRAGGFLQILPSVWSANIDLDTVVLNSFPKKGSETKETPNLL